MYHLNLNVNVMFENVIQIKNGIMINDDASVKNIKYMKKDYLWNPVTCSCENGHYLLSNIDGSVITCDEITDAKETKTIPKSL